MPLLTFTRCVPDTRSADVQAEVHEANLEFEVDISGHVS